MVYMEFIRPPSPVGTNVFHFHGVSVADSCFIHYSICRYESKPFMLADVFVDIVHCALAAQSEPCVGEVTYTH